jgi:hypothetical protein
VGMSLMPNCSSTGCGVAPNPNPGQWRFIRGLQYGKNCVVLVRYVGCTNFEGRKVLVFKNRTVGEIKATRYLDLPFSDSDLSPIARLRPPDDEGWIYAQQLALNMDGGDESPT